MDDLITVKRGKVNQYQIRRDVFELLFNHTVVRRRAGFKRALETGLMTLDDFMSLTLAGEVPYPLFFAPLDHVKRVIAEYEKIVFYGVSKEQISIASRGDIELADISLIVKDITRKQSFMKTGIDSNNDLPGRFKKDRRPLGDKAAELRSIIGYDITTVHSQRTKEQTFNYLRESIASNHVYTSIYVHNQCPQNIAKNLQFSGIALNDKKSPYIFIRTSDENSVIEPWGRRLFTLSLLLGCLCSGKYGPVTLDGRARDIIRNDQYEFAEEFLMPTSLIRLEACSSLDDLKLLAEKYAVSPSAMTMRLSRLGVIDINEKEFYLDLLFREFDKAIRERAGGNSLKLEKAIARYNSPELVKTVLGQVNNGVISARDAKNLLYYKKGDSFKLSALETYL